MQELFDENEGGCPVLGKTVASGQLPVVSRKMLGLKLSLVSAVPGGTPIRKTSWARIRRTARRTGLSWVRARLVSPAYTRPERRRQIAVKC